MPQYLLAVHNSGVPALSREEMRQSLADTGAVNDKMTAAGAFVFAGGLLPAESATVVSQSGDDILITDGPYTEAKEHLAGFWVIRAADLDEALDWAQLATVACRAAVEVRPFDDRDLDAILDAVLR